MRQVGQPDINSVRILVVDDELPVRTLLCRFLNTGGYATQTADCVASARLELERQQFDLVISDLDMPGASGIELLHYLKSDFPETGRIMATGTSSVETAREIMEIGVYGYLLKPFTQSMVLISVQNALSHLQADRVMQVYKKNLEDEVWRRTEKLQTIMDNLRVGVTMVSADFQLVEMNRQMEQWFPDAGIPQTQKCFQIFSPERGDCPCEDCPMTKTLTNGQSAESYRQLLTIRGKRDFHVVTSPIYDQDRKVVAGIGLYEDITEMNMIEQELRQSQKIEAIGQLAAGITHEINTPVQFVGDNLSFLQQAYTDISRVLATYSDVFELARNLQEVPGDKIQAVLAAIDAADLLYLQEEIPTTIAQSLDGVKRIEKIVRAMKEFSHPGNDEKVLVSINELLETTLTISRNQWKYEAELETDLQPGLPLVSCLPGELNQVFLNLIVNAAHAIADRNRENPGKLGKITITSCNVTGAVQVRIKDSGGGIPEVIRNRIFEPFFTTKGRGKGTGQGLAISRRVVVEKHQGQLFFEVDPGVGTTFFVEIPV